ncbi:N-6 DNA methylase, partial [Salmonella enterica subsp. enterica serovar Typhimurium]|uniref:N-6 DNA methylase n=1 Tax=Salmonella enterica TaxID=28901 RepID=UPI002FFC037D
ARKLGVLVDRTRREFTPDEIGQIAETYHSWRNKDGGYEDVPGFCKSATIEEVRKKGYVLTPGRFVGAADAEDDGLPFEEKVGGFRTRLAEQFKQADVLSERIKSVLGGAFE